MSTFESELRRAFDASVPLAHVVTADAPATTNLAIRTLTELAADDPPLFYLASPLFGLEALTEASAARLGDLTGGMDPSMLSDPASLLQALAQLPTDGTAPDRVVMWSGADRAWSDPGLGDALLLMRDRLAARAVTLLGLGSGNVQGAIASHVHVIRDALPEDAQRLKIATDVLESSDIIVGEQERAALINQTRGLPPFAVSQVATLAATSGTLDLEQLAARTRETLGGLPGVTVETPLSLDAFGGSDAWIGQLRLYRNAAPSLVVIVDELEKVTPTMDANDSGVSRTLLGMILGHLSRTKPIATITMGTPGTGKTLSGLVAGSLFGCPVVRINPGEWKGGQVGDSERNAGQALDTLAAFGGKQLWVGTSNGLETVPEELRDRFRGGVWFFDLPTSAELPAIWRANLARYGFDPNTPAPDLTGWSGRDIETACLEAIDTARAVLDVTGEIVPAARKMAARIERMRTAARAEGYRSADTGLPYAGPAVATAAAPRVMRRRAPAAAAAAAAAPAAPESAEEMF